MPRGVTSHRKHLREHTHTHTHRCCQKAWLLIWGPSFYEIEVIIRSTWIAFQAQLLIVFNSMCVKYTYTQTHSQPIPAISSCLLCHFKMLIFPVFLIHIHKPAHGITMTSAVEINLGTGRCRIMYTHMHTLILTEKIAHCKWIRK